MASTIYTQEIADYICEQLAGGRSLISICKDEGMPNIATVLRWIPKFPGFRDDYARAREMWAEFEFENMMRIADTPRIGTRTKENDDGTETVTEDMLGHRSLQVSTRKWVLERMAPKKYGVLIKNEISNPDGSLSSMTPEQKAAKLEAIRVATAQRLEQEDRDAGLDLV
jgi:hypothetical protein